MFRELAVLVDKFEMENDDGDEKDELERSRLMSDDDELIELSLVSSMSTLVDSK